MENEYKFTPMYRYEEFYEITRDGVVRSKKTGNILNGSFDKIGQVMKISLSIEGKRKLVPLHILIYETYVEPIKVEPGKRFFVKHKDNDPYNCTVENIYISGASIIKKEKPIKEKQIKEIKPKKEKPVKIKKIKPIKIKEEVKIQRGFEKTYDKNGHYIQNSKLIYEIVLSRGMGKRSRNLEQMLYKISEGVWVKLTKGATYDFKYDMLNDILLQIYRKWNKFNEKKYDDAIPYFTEIAKRAAADSWNRNVYKTDRYLILGKNKFVRMDGIYNL